MVTNRYTNKYPSVTTVLGVLRKVGLEMWFKNNTAEYCDAESSKGKKFGSSFHELLQKLISGQETKIETDFDEELKNAVGGFVAFRKDYPNLKLELAELKMTSEKYKYNGTLDCLGVWEDKLIIADWKTGKSKEGKKPDIYDEYVIQVSAYVNLYNEIYNTNVDKAIIVAFAKNEVNYNIETVESKTIELAFNEIFLPALQIYNGMKELKKIRF